ncbi:hypothetical protein ACP4OV_016771 [Aristida adscensionis]
MAAAAAAAVSEVEVPSLGERIGAALARWGAVRAAADAVVYLHFGAIWVGMACYFPTILGRGSAVADAAARLQVFAVLLGVLLAPAGVVLYCLRVVGAADTKAPEPRPGRVDVSRAEAGFCCAVAGLLQAMVQDVALLAVVVSTPFFLLVYVGLLIDGGSHEEGHVGGLLVNVGALGTAAANAFVVYPNLALRLWKVQRREKRVNSSMR